MLRSPRRDVVRLANASGGGNRETGWVGATHVAGFCFCASGGRAAGVGRSCSHLAPDATPGVTTPGPTGRGIMRHSVLKHWLRPGLVLVASLALVVVGCGKEGGGTGPAADYTLSLAPAALTIVQGATGNTTVTITRTNFSGAVTLSLGGAPTGVTGSFSPSAPTGTTSALTVSVAAAVAPGVYNLTVAGTGGPGNRSTPLTLTVSPAPDYALSLAPATLTIVQGANGTTAVTITRTNFTGAVTLGLGSAPSGVTGSFDPAAPTGTSVTLTVSVAAAVAPGVYNLTVDGTGTPGNRSTPLTLTVSAAPDYTLSLAPAALTIIQGTTGTTTVTIARTNFTGAVTLSLGSAPAGVTGAFNPAAPGVYNLTVAGSGSPGNRSTSLNLTVSAAPDYALSLAPAALTIGQGATGTSTVTITRTNFTGAVTLSLGSAPAGVTGSFNPAAPTGTSSTLTVSVGAAVTAGVYNLTVDGAGTPGNRSTPLTLTVSAPAAKLVFTVHPSTAAAGAAITPAVQVAVQDAQGNTVTTATTSITLAIGTNPASGTLAGTTTVAAVSGVATYANLSINRAGSGYTLTASATGLTGATSSAFNITVGAAAKLAFTVQPSTAVAGAAITPAVQVAVQDAQGNTVTTATTSITVAIGTNPASGTLAGTKTVAAVNGVATFSTLSLNLAGTGYTLTATATGLTSATSSAFNISAGEAAKLVLTVQPSTAAAGAGIAPAVQVAVQDAQGNTVTTATTSITVAIGTNPASGTLAGTTTMAAVNGVATFSTLSLNKSATGYTLIASATGLTGATSSAFNIGVGAAAKLVFTVQPSNAAAGGAITPAMQVAVQDAQGNTVMTATTSISLAIGSNSASGTLAGTTTVAAVNSVASFAHRSINNPGTGYT